MPWGPWLAVVYALATIVASVEHHHHPGGAHGETPRAEAGCADGGVHLAHHPDAPDLSGGPDACPVCQFRAQPSLRPSFGAFVLHRCPVAAAAVVPDAAPARIRLRSSSRAPPVC